MSGDVRSYKIQTERSVNKAKHEASVRQTVALFHKALNDNDL